MKSSTRLIISQPQMYQSVRNLVHFWFDPRFGLTQIPEPIKILAKLVHQGLRYGAYDGTLEGKKDQPQLKIRTLDMPAS